MMVSIRIQSRVVTSLGIHLFPLRSEILLISRRNHTQHPLALHLNLQAQEKAISRLHTVSMRIPSKHDIPSRSSQDH